MFSFSRLLIVTCLFVVSMGLVLFATLPSAMASNTPDNESTALPQDAIQFLSDPKHLMVQSEEGLHRFTIELAVGQAALAKGLMFRTKMNNDHGMLFDFGKSAPIYMWMKNTYISLDMLFVLEDGTIHHIARSTTPLSKTIIGSGGSVRYVLEVKSGTADRLGVKPGDKLLHQLFTPK